MARNVRQTAAFHGRVWTTSSIAKPSPKKRALRDAANCSAMRPRNCPTSSSMRFGIMRKRWPTSWSKYSSPEILKAEPHLEPCSTCPYRTTALSCDPWLARLSTSASVPKSRRKTSACRHNSESAKSTCRREGFEILERFKEEGESAKTADRRELQRMLAYCRSNKGKVHFLVVFNLTRFARDKYDHFALRSHLKSLGISLRSATEPIDDTSTGKVDEGVLAAFAQFDNDVRSDRTRAGMQEALRRGRWTFLGPLGYLNAPRAMRKSDAGSERVSFVGRSSSTQLARIRSRKFCGKQRSGD